MVCYSTLFTFEKLGYDLEKAGFKLHRDCLHLNAQGAIMIADLIKGYIKRGNNTSNQGIFASA